MSEIEPGTELPPSDDYVSDRKFTEMPLSPEVLKGVLEMGYTVATPVQAETIDAALAGRDMLVRAKTGTGKTAAFAIPAIERTANGARVPSVLILEPTRELAQQTAGECDKIARYRDVSTVTLVGGLAIGPQEQRLQAGAELIVGTPGRVKDHLGRGTLNLSSVHTVVLDEADEMLSMGFYEDVTDLLDACGDAQVLLFSATISPETERLVQRYLEEPEQVILSTDADRVEGITHVVYETSPDVHKVRSLLYLLDIEDPDSAIIFCNTREDAATVATFLDRQGLDVQLLSGELPQGRRSQVMAKVKSGEVRFLAATDVAARGIDISELSHVINYALPPDPAVYLHRTGRTGRIGKRGTAISLVGGTDMATRKVLENQYDIEFEQRLLPDAETIVRRRVERQAKQIRDALGTIVFEAYLPTVRALKETPDGDALLAAALRAFFTWQRERKAALSGVDSIGDLARARSEKEARRERDRDGGHRKKHRDRKERGSSRDRGGSHDRGASGDRRPSGDGGSDDLLLVEGEGAGPRSGEGSAPPASGEGGRKKRKRRRRRGKGGAEGGGEGHGADLDALLTSE